MRTKLFVTLVALFIAITTAPLAHAGECTFDRTLGVGGSALLSVSTGSGDVRVTVGSDSTIKIHGHVRSGHGGWFGGTEGNAQAVCDKPPVEQNGNSIKIGSDHSDIYRHVAIDYVIETPRSTELDASTGSGDLELNGIGGRTTASTGSGDVRVSNLAADAKINTGSGNIHAAGLAGGSKLSTGSGDIHLDQTAPGDVHASTGSGNIEIAGMSGGLNAGTGSGWIHVDGTPTSNWKLGTGSGDVRVRVEGGKGYELDAESSSGDINVNAPMTSQGNQSKHLVHGMVGGGGPLLHIETGSGNIELK